MTIAPELAKKKKASLRAGKFQAFGSNSQIDAEAGEQSPTPPDAQALLAWYDRHQRKLPWRAGPGETPDPYRVWISEIMLQQTTVKAVAPYFERFLAQWPSVETLASASLDDVLRAWAGLGYYARARHLHRCAKAVVELHGGCFPDTETDLAALPGIGSYTAAAIAAIAFDRRAAAVDGNVERVIARLYALNEEFPGAKAIVRRLAQELVPARRAGDFAQALMDLGATLCTPKKPACAICPWTASCLARRRGDPETFPRKLAKREGRLRRGAAFVVLRADGALLVQTRPARGLLGGMTEVPTSEWTHNFDFAAALVQAPRLGLSPNSKERQSKLKWRRIVGTVTHTFTHFPLELVVYRADAPQQSVPRDQMRWLPAAEIGREALPNVMRKVILHATAHRPLARREKGRRPRRQVAPVG